MRLVPSRLKYTGAALLAALQVQHVTAFEDDFDDGNDDRWAHFDPLAEVQLAAPAPLSFDQAQPQPKP